MNTRRPLGLFVMFLATSCVLALIMFAPIFVAKDNLARRNGLLDDLEAENQTISRDLLDVLTVLNHSGGEWKQLDSLLTQLETEQFGDSSLATHLKRNMSTVMEHLRSALKSSQVARRHFVGQRPSVTVATIICGKRRSIEAMNMLKSLFLFSQDATLHLVVFSDLTGIYNVAQDVLTLKWTMQEKYGWDFTYELHLDEFPQNTGIVWKRMYRLCATQRLFFPDLLPHIDSVIYLDTDMIVVSNVTELWNHFHRHMEKQELAAAAMNNEETYKGWYGPGIGIPYYGTRGINAGIMLMNLTRMRNFKFSTRSVLTQKAYGDRIQLADQDIVNIIFANYPELFSVLNCSYNFNWVHCGGEGLQCMTSWEQNICFCKAVLHDGVRVVHGNSNTFFSEEIDHTFLPQLYQAFTNFDLVADDPEVLFKRLKDKFDLLEPKPCMPLSSDMLYKNAITYFRNLDAPRLTRRNKST